MAQDRTTAYAKLICSGVRLAGHSEYLACKRHLNDMAKKNFPYIFDVREAEKHINIANELTIGEGDVPQKLKTRGFQNFIIGSLFGWRKKRSHLRRFREGYVQVGRQNGKSFLAGELCNDFASFSGYQYGRIFCTATKQDQANIVWDEVDKFIESDGDLKELYKIKQYDHTILSLLTGTTIKAIGRDTKSADGFRSILAVIDEYHAHPTDQMYALMRDGQIKVDNALTLAITTAGFDLNGPCYAQYEFAKKVLAGVVEKESLFVYIAEMDEDDDCWNPQNWAKANPLNLWTDDLTLDEEMLARMAEKAIDAKEKQGDDLINFLTKSLNVWVKYAGGQLINLDHWKACASELTIADMKGRSCYLGIDLSSGGDLTSIALLFPLDDEKIYLYSHSFMPKLRLQEHERTDKAPYRDWVHRKLLTLTTGMYGIKTDYKFIIAHLAKLIQVYDIDIIGVGYDNHNAAAFLSDLGELLACDLTEVKQSARALNDCTVDFQLSVKAHQVLYDKRNALLTWSVVNAIVDKNSFGEIKVDKKTQTERIDTVDSILDAWDLYWLDKNQVGLTAEQANEIMDHILGGGDNT
ncbi:terminase large subunit [Megasphaera sueciensis]|uniref:terminase large subunit n=1 Tax=Megasphaera sueciensis TaxID=349094 RepID=UPI003D01C08B